MDYYQTCPLRKPEPRKRTKARKDRTEAAVEKAVRAECVERDGYCRFGKDMQSFIDVMMGIVTDAYRCEGPSQWSHLESRARTRKMRPGLRHNTKITCQLCKRHHDNLDGRDKPRLRVKLLTGRGADGPLQWRTS